MSRSNALSNPVKATTPQPIVPATTPQTNTQVQPSGPQPGPHPLSALHNAPSDPVDTHLANLLSQPVGTSGSAKPRKTSASTALKRENMVSRLSLGRMAKTSRETESQESSARGRMTGRETSRVMFSPKVSNYRPHLNFVKFGLPDTSAELKKQCKDSDKAGQLCSNLNAWIEKLPATQLEKEEKLDQVAALEMTHDALRACASLKVTEAVIAGYRLIAHARTPDKRQTMGADGVQPTRVNLSDQEFKELLKATTALEKFANKGPVTNEKAAEHLEKFKRAILRSALGPLVTFVSEYYDHAESMVPAEGKLKPEAS